MGGIGIGGDGPHQQLPQRRVDLGVAEHVVHLVAVDAALLFDLGEQPLEHLALTGLIRDQVPQMTRPLLTNAVHPPETLLDPVRVPRQVVVDHHVGHLQVDALAGRVGGHQHPHRRIDPEPVLDGAAVVALDAAVDADHRLRPPQLGLDPLGHIVEGVPVLREHDQLADRRRAVARVPAVVR